MGSKVFAIRTPSQVTLKASTSTNDDLPNGAQSADRQIARKPRVPVAAQVADQIERAGDEDYILGRGGFERAFQRRAGIGNDLDGLAPDGASSPRAPRPERARAGATA